MAMDPRNHVAVRASSTTAPVSTTHSSSVVAPSAARKVLETGARTPAENRDRQKQRTVRTRPAVLKGWFTRITKLQLQAQGIVRNSCSSCWYYW